MNRLGPDTWNQLHDGRVAALLEIGLAAAARTLDFFQTDRYQVERKRDDSPVTAADRAAEQLMRQRVHAAFALDGFLGEEFGEVDSSGHYRWIVDPIDGTKSFIAGVPLYSTLLGLEYRGQIVAGIILIPALDELVIAARGEGAWWRRRGGAWQRCQVSNKTTLADAVFLTSQVDSFMAQGAASAYERLQADCWITRTWGDAYGYLLVATGRADVMVDPIVNPWDVAAIEPVMLEAGGQFSDWSGVCHIHGGNAVGTNRVLHETVLARLKANG